MSKVSEKIHLTHWDYLKIAVPFIISTVTQPLLGAVDTAVVGRLSDPAYIAGVSVGSVIFNTMYWLFGFLRVSTTSYSAQAYGKESERDRTTAFFRPCSIALIVGLGFIILQNPLFKATMSILSPEKEVQSFTGTYFYILIWGAPFVLVNYVILGWLMGQAKLKMALFMQISGNVLNILLDLLFVQYFNMNVGGVAAATLISQVVTFMIGAGFIVMHGKFDKEEMKIKSILHRSSLMAMMRVNADLMVRTACLLIQTNLFTATSASYGTLMLSANAILHQIQYVISYMFDGLANASSFYAGKAAGQRQEALLKACWRKTGEWVGIFILCITPVYVLLRKELILLFTDIGEVIRLAGSYDLWIALYPLIAGIGLAFYGVFTGTAVTRPVRNSTIMALGLSILVWAAAVPIWHNHGLWLSLLSFYFGRSLFLIVQLKKTRLIMNSQKEGEDLYARAT
ncbi:MATE family efflux transporter [Cellulosilyticum sp. I15G10I2]|uniref:MATE family efflux transporter n=1 Tax=Cellulosilyticum sp. I15G10I2 TaxID=1892843 RepID=UPI00085C830B|nr:MATE family efflux transporter [Cellulosilyticum sp. I15G10I2]